MSAFGPEFYNFLKKLEVNGDKLIPPAPLEQPIEFQFNNTTCYVCNGYYGPSFGEPVCVTCHAFLFPDFPSYLPSSYFYSEKTDDGDSGNDEPSDLNYSSERKVKPVPHPGWWYYKVSNNSLDSETSPEDDAIRAANFGPGGSGCNGNGVKGGPSGPFISSGSRGGPSGVPNGAGRSGPSGPTNGAGGKGGPIGPPKGPPGLEDRAGFGPPPPPPNLTWSLQALSTPRPPDNLEPGLVEQLPSEVLLCIFSYLDDLSLSACAHVCRRWCSLVRARVAPARWQGFASTRWPLFKPMLLNIDWLKKYQSLVESCFCRNCLVQMCVQAQPAGEENFWRRNRLRIELKMMRNDPPEGIAATPLDAKCCHWQASVTGPVGSPYEGGLFFLYIQVPYSYPMSPPVVRFLTRILHPNVSRHGDVGIDSVHHNWSLALTLSKVLISIQSLLTDPYTAVCMEPELGEMYVRDRGRFEALARRWTWRYAAHDALPD